MNNFYDSDKYGWITGIVIALIGIIMVMAALEIIWCLEHNQRQTPMEKLAGGKVYAFRGTINSNRFKL